MMNFIMPQSFDVVGSSSLLMKDKPNGYIMEEAQHPQAPFVRSRLEPCDEFNRNLNKQVATIVAILNAMHHL